MNSLFDVSGKVAVVTGGSGVLGSNISEGLLTVSYTHLTLPTKRIV